MYSYRTEKYLTYTVHIVEVLADSSMHAQLSVMALPYGPENDVEKTTINWHDIALENDGWTRKAVINGGLFFTESGITYASGIEKAYGVTNENDDTAYSGVMALAHSGSNSNTVILDTQLNIASSLSNYRGAVTGAFGLLKNGLVNQGNTSLLGSYTSKSGRSIIGNKLDGTLVFASVAGVTGSSGLTGSQCLSLAQNLNLYNAIAMDGGGSVGLVYDDVWKVSSSRTVKNAIAIYTKAVNLNIPMYTQIDNTQKQVDTIKVMVNGELKTVNQVLLKTSGILKSVFENNN